MTERIQYEGSINPKHLRKQGVDRGRLWTLLVLEDKTVETVDSFKYLGTTVSFSLNWRVSVSIIVQKAHQWLFF